jgi:hypothetical protein
VVFPVLVGPDLVEVGPAAPHVPVVIAVPLVPTDDNKNKPKTRHEMVAVPGGWLVFRPGVSIDAKCSHCDHVRCHMDRTVAPLDPATSHRGRPLGFLLAWLAYGDCGIALVTWPQTRQGS